MVGIQELRPRIEPGAAMRDGQSDDSSPQARCRGPAGSSNRALRSPRRDRDRSRACARPRDTRPPRLALNHTLASGRENKARVGLTGTGNVGQACLGSSWEEYEEPRSWSSALSVDPHLLEDRDCLIGMFRRTEKDCTLLVTEYHAADGINASLPKPPQQGVGVERRLIFERN